MGILSKNWEASLQNCKFCPVECGADRTKGVGACGVDGLTIAKFYLHPFEEPCISFDKGSGTIFFGGCNLRCPYCQNYEVSRAQRGKKISPLELTDIFKKLEDMGADNISFVTPSHVIPYLCEALELYRPSLPIVYNSGGYDKIDSLKAIDKYVDIYLPDCKFYSSSLSARYLGKEDYFDVAEEAIRFMAQKPLQMTSEGKMLSGLIVRHLVMPLCVSDSKAILRWFSKNVGDKGYLSLMSQYTPFGDVEKYPELSRGITAREYDAVLSYADELGIQNLFAQERASKGEKYIPKWDF